MNKNYIIKFCLFLLFAGSSLTLTGCATNATVDGMTVRQDSKLPTPQKKLKNGIFLQEISGGKETNPLWTSQISNENFKTALAESLKNAGYVLVETNRAPYILKATLVKVKKPLIGVSMKVSSIINYVLIEKSTNKMVLNEDINASYVAKFGDAFYGPQRLRLANEGSAQQNIGQLISKLSQLNPDKVSIQIK